MEQAGAKETLLQLLHQNRTTYHVEYESYLSNHLAMALVALYQLGATSERLTQYYNEYVLRLEPAIPSNKFITATNWNLYLGEKKFYNDYRDFFRSEKDRLGGNIKQLLSEYVPTLIEGVIGAAFHPVILLGYGIEIMDIDTELIIDGLAYMAYAYRSLGKLNQHQPRRTYVARDLLKRVYIEHAKNVDYADPRVKFPTKIDLFLAKEPEVLDKYDILKIDTQNDVTSAMDQISEAMIGLYSCTYDFFVLHGVTSCYAFKNVLSVVDPQFKTMMVQYYARALVATYIVQGQPALHFANPKLWQRELNTVTWSTVLTSALNGKDEHMIKLIWTCWKENKERKREIYLLCAAQKAGLIEKQQTETTWWPWVAAAAAIATGVYIRMRSTASA